VPLWFRILAAADFDPLRAQEIEDNLRPEWWYWYWQAMAQRAKVQK